MQHHFSKFSRAAAALLTAAIMGTLASTALAQAPGGGFQGGAILASAILMLLLADPLREFSHRLISVIESISGLLFVAVGLLGMVYAGGFLDNRILPLGTLGDLISAGAIPVIYSFIGLKVGAEFSSMMVNLSETEEP